MTDMKPILLHTSKLLLCLLFAGCVSNRPALRQGDAGFLDRLFRQNPGSFSAVFQHPDSFRVQVIYTQIDRRRNNEPVFTDYFYHVSSANYFYPASTVKMPVALLALQKLKQEAPPSILSTSPMITETANPWETPVYNDPFSESGNPSIAAYVKKIFLVSDNDAFNRLYEFCGQDYINDRLRFMGYDSSEIMHRLSVPLSAEQNRYSNPITLFGDSGSRWVLPAHRSDWVRYNRNESVGKGFLQNGKLVSQPFDFANKNRFLLPDLHQVLRSILFPASVPDNQRFDLHPADRSLVLKAMSEYPKESRFPWYDSTEYYDAYAKFILMGAENQPPPTGVRIFDKVGEAYGFVTDIAYVVDFNRKIEFMVSATIYCNADGIFNDDRYEYESLGFPFMKHIGQVFYNYEQTRPRKRLPVLDGFRISYDDRPAR